MTPKVVLAFDTATPATIVGVSVDGEVVSQLADRPEVDERPRHAERLLSLCEQALSEAGKAWADVDRLGVGVGPGTFTGLRIGIATARGLQQACGAQAVAVSSLEALSLPARIANPGSRVAAVLDARRSEAFVACWDNNGARVVLPRAVGPERLAAAIGADAGGVLAVGDGAVLFRGSLEEASITVPKSDSPLHHLAATSLCQLTATGEPSDPERLMPDYVRRADAEIALDKRLNDGD